MVAQVKVVSGALVAVLDVRAMAPGRVYSRLDVAVELSLSGHDNTARRAALPELSGSPSAPGALPRSAPGALRLV